LSVFRQIFEALSHSVRSSFEDGAHEQHYKNQVLCALLTPMSGASS
jgi:hypothetical protein